MKKYILILSILIFCFSCTKETSESSPTVEIPSTEEAKNEILSMLNQHRDTLELEPLENVFTIERQALYHCENIVSDSVPYGHDNWEERMKEIRTHLYFRGKDVVDSVERIARYRPMPTVELIKFWLKDEETKKILEGDFDRTGISILADTSGELYYYTQIFIKTKDRIQE